MMRTVVIGVDSSTTSTKAIAWDRQGRPVAEGNAPVPMASFPPNAFEQDPRDWWASCCTALRTLTGALDGATVDAVCVTTQRETVGFLDAAGAPVRPAVVWLDERRRPDVGRMVADLGLEHLRDTTGKTPDPTPAVYALAWLRRCEPDAFARTAHFVDVHGYLAWRLTGRQATSWASADPHGLWDITRRRFDPAILGWLGVTPDRFFPPLRPGTVLGRVSEAAAAATGLPVGTQLVCGGGDGQAGALGCAVLGEGRACLNLGTATVSGVHGDAPLTGPHWRTMTSLAGDGYVFELVLRTGAFLTDWLVERLLGFDPRRDPGCYDRLETEAERLPPGSEGLLLLPHWSGIMNPHWNVDARGMVAGFGPEHHRGHVYRALIEGIALEIAEGYAALVARGVAVHEVVAIGGGARSRLWRRIMADATDRRLTVSGTVEASSLGAAMLAAHAAGWFPTLAATAAAMQGAAMETLTPDPAAAARYAALRPIHQRMFPAMQSVFADLATFRAGDAP